MKKIIIIAARSRNGVIGKNGSIPWNLPFDLERFKRLTLDYPIIMGKNTWISLPRKPLPKRVNIVVTSDRKLTLPEGHHVAPSLQEALALCKNHERIFLIGGEAVYREGLNFANTIYLTEVDIECDGDAFFPEIDSKKWRLHTEISDPRQLMDHPPSRFVVYHKK